MKTTKKLLAALLCLIMVLGLLPGAASAASGSASISLDKTTYATGETIRITPSGVPSDMSGYVRLLTAGAPHSASSIWNSNVRATTGVMTCTNTLSDGSYEMRLYRSGTYNDSTLIMTVPFTVNSSSVTISLDKTTYVTGETIRITPSGIGQNMSGYVRLLTAGAPHSASSIWNSNVRATTGVMTCTNTLSDGSYEMRLYRSGTYNDSTLIMTVPFTVNSSSVTISLDKTTYAAGERIRITPSGIGQNMSGYVRLLAAGAPHSASSIWNSNVRATTGVMECTRNLSDGSYEMRLYRSGTYNDNTLIMTVHFTVGGAAPAPTPTPTPTPTPSPEPEPTPSEDIHTGSASHLRGNNNSTYSFSIIGASSGSVWGTDIYTDDSIIARAAVHAGLVTVGQAATVTIRILPGRASYTGSARNGVTSSSYGQWSGSYEFVTSGTAPGPGGGGLTEDSLDMILDEANAGSGQITVSLIWATSDDLDLHMITPAGNEIMYNRKSADGGTLDVDRNASTIVANPVENIFFPAPSPGTYKVKLVNYRDRTSGTSTEYLIRVTVGSSSKTFTGTIDGTGTARDIVEFTIRTAGDGTVTDSDLTGDPLTPEPTPGGGSQPGGFAVEPISAGVKLRWNGVSGGVGYRVYRSENQSDDGISVTDFYITSNEFVDVNVRPSTTYYYSVRQVIREARPFEGLPEELGPVTSRVTVTTPGTLLGAGLTPPSAGAQKSFILMTIDDPIMSINGIRQEIDPGRGTAPTLLNSRTMVPIRAIVEGMGGTVGWNDSTREVSLNYMGSSVRMWLDRYDLTVNGVSSSLDVPPTTINDRTMVPIRFAAENLGCEVDWLNSTRQVVIVYY